MGGSVVRLPRAERNNSKVAQLGLFSGMSSPNAMQSGRSQSNYGYNKFVSQEQRIIRNQSQKVLPMIESTTNRNQNSTSNMSLVRQRQQLSSQQNLETHNFGGYTSRELKQLCVDPLDD